MRQAQALAILGMELKKNFITKRGFWIYLLAAVPAIIVWLHSIVTIQRASNSHDLSKDTNVLAVLFGVFFLRPAVFFGCVGIFTYLFRGEFVERSLHYYFLAPVRREILVVAKFAAGLITAAAFFGGSMVLTFAGMYAHYPQFQVKEWMLSGPGLGHLGAYVGITILACMAWGSMFLWTGIRFRNPIIPAVVLLTWESASVFMPSWLRKVSVLHHLQSLVPVQGDLRGPGVLLGATPEPEKAVVAILYLFVFTGLMLALSAVQLRTTEVSYSTD